MVSRRIRDDQQTRFTEGSLKTKVNHCAVLNESFVEISNIAIKSEKIKPKKPTVLILE